MKLTMLRHESPANPTCPAFYDTDTEWLVVVCKKITDPTVMPQIAHAIADDEIVGMIPKTLAPEVLTNAHS